MPDRRVQSIRAHCVWGEGAQLLVDLRVVFADGVRAWANLRGDRRALLRAGLPLPREVPLYAPFTLALDHLPRGVRLQRDEGEEASWWGRRRACLAVGGARPLAG